MELTSQEKILIDVARTLEKLHLPYFVTGGFAVSLWGRPRATFDVDIVIQLMNSDINPLAKALKEVSKLGYIDEDMMKDAVKWHREFNFIDPESGMKVDFMVSPNDEFSRSRFKRKSAKEIGGQQVYFTSPEDLILSKLLWQKESGSELQLRDVESIIKISGRKLDRSYLEEWARKLGVWDVLDGILEDAA
ncbi:MAG: hypothetical protein AAB897_00955 [Patescibacteria group bacterium]